jgi:hypothetical protein
MIGATVLMTRLEDETVEGPFGPALCRVYYLRPGVNLVYVEVDAPHRILKLSQSVGKYALEANLSRVTEGRALEPSRPERQRPQEGRRPQRDPRAARPERQQDAAKTEASSPGRRGRRRGRNRGERLESSETAPRETAPKQPRTPAEPQRHSPSAADTEGVARAKRRRRVRRRGGKGNGNGGGGAGES